MRKHKTRLSWERRQITIHTSPLRCSKQLPISHLANNQQNGVNVVLLTVLNNPGLDDSDC
jgi:hypothetical protein